MTYAIETYFIGPSNVRGARIAARVMERGTGYGMKQRKLVLHWDHALSSSDNHKAAAMALASKLGWAGVWVEGGSDEGASVWVNTSMFGREAFEVEPVAEAA